MTRDKELGSLLQEPDSSYSSESSFCTHESGLDTDKPAESALVTKRLGNDRHNATSENCRAAPGGTRQPPLAEQSRPMVQDYAVL